MGTSLLPHVILGTLTNNFLRHPLGCLQAGQARPFLSTVDCVSAALGGNSYLSPTSRLEGVSALDNSDQDSDDRQNEQDVNVGSQRVKRDHAQKPTNEKNRRDCPKHSTLLGS